MIGLLDADILLYRCGFAVEKRIKKENPDGSIEHLKEVEPLNHALQNVSTVVDWIGPKFEKMEFYLTGKGNFRHDVATIKKYKGNRSPFARPTYYKEMREFIENKYKATVVDGMEADDAIGIRATDGCKACVVTIDKDLDQIPGRHFNWVKNDNYEISEVEGLRCFYRQMLIGDGVDNIPGLKGFGPVKAGRAIDDLSKESAMWTTVKELWHKHQPDGLSGKGPDAVLSEIGLLLWIRRTGRTEWQPPA